MSNSLFSLQLSDFTVLAWSSAWKSTGAQTFSRFLSPRPTPLHPSQPFYSLCFFYSPSTLFLFSLSQVFISPSSRFSPLPDILAHRPAVLLPLSPSLLFPHFTLSALIFHLPYSLTPSVLKYQLIIDSR